MLAIGLPHEIAHGSLRLTLGADTTKEDMDKTIEAIKEIVQKVVDTNPNQAEAYRGGKVQLLGFFVGQVMKETKGRANPKTVNELLKEILG